VNSRERVQAAIKGLPVDRVPVFLWINAHAGCKMMAELKPSRHWSWNFLARLFWKRLSRGGAEAKEIWRTLPLFFDIHAFNWANAYGLELGSDLLLASHSTPWQYTSYGWDKGHLLFKDLYGVTRAVGQGIYPDMIRPAISEVKDLASYCFPDAADPRRYNIFRKYRKSFPDKAIGAEVWGTQDFTATSLFGMERFMLFLVDYPEEMKKFMSRWADWHIEVLRRSVKAGADMVVIEDDYGCDNRPLISLSMWKEFTYPQLRRLIDAGHEAGALVMLHSCGYQMPFLPYYVEAGLDALHPLQPKAGNDFKAAYEQFGNKLAFAAGIDIQSGEWWTPEELRQDVVRNYRLAGRKGRHIISTTHEIQPTMPVPNMRAIFGVLEEISSGKFD